MSANSESTAGKPLGAPLRAMDALPAVDPAGTGGFVLFQMCWLIAGVVASVAAVGAGNNGSTGNDVGTETAFAFFGLLLAWCCVGALRTRLAVWVTCWPWRAG